VREREREREYVSSGGLWKIYRDPPSISSAGVKIFSLVGMLFESNYASTTNQICKAQRELLMMISSALLRVLKIFGSSFGR
jgi:hypothetical protein